jgi:hypothetical protein
VWATAVLAAVTVAVACGDSESGSSGQSAGEGGQADGSGGNVSSGGNAVTAGGPGAAGERPGSGGDPQTGGSGPVNAGGADPSASGAGGEDSTGNAGAPGSAAGAGGDSNSGVGGGGGDDSAGGAGGSSGCVLPTPLTTVPSTSAEVLECGLGFVDEQEHQLGGLDGQYFKTEDDLRLGTCGEDVCTRGGQHPYGLDLFFLPPTTTGVIGAQINLRALPNDGMPATLTLRDHCSGQVVDTCLLNPGNQWYEDCTLELPVTDVVPTGMYYTLEVSIDSCFLVFDIIQLKLTTE